MKKFLVALAAILAFNSPAFSQVAKPKAQDQEENVLNKPVLCYPAPLVLKVVQEKFKQQVLFVVNHEYSNETMVAMFVNTETNTYTLIEFNAETACILASGANFKLQPLKPPGVSI